jgi:RNA processing factor Prp31
MPRFLVLFENVVGFSLFDCKGINEIAITEMSVQQSIISFNLFSTMVRCITFRPFPSTEVALSAMNAITEGQIPEVLQDFLADALPGQIREHSSGIVLGVSEPKLAGAIRQQFDITCQSDPVTREVLRGIRLHFERFVQEVTADDVRLAQLGLSHGYSRSKVKFNEHGDDNMVISAVALLGGLEKDLNTFGMRLREWYSVHFPELSKIVEDTAMYGRVVEAIGNRASIDERLVLEVTSDADLTRTIVSAASNSIGREIEEVDLVRIVEMAQRVVSLATYRTQLALYLRSRMHSIAPNLTELTGERMGAQLIMASGSLTNLAKAPASTIQLLGAEKALFNALKKRKNTPKYGLIYNSGAVTAASTNSKGRVARSLANKISIVGRVDAFGEEFRSGYFGSLLRQMMEKRVASAQTGVVEEANLDAMEKAVVEARRMEQREVVGEPELVVPEPEPVVTPKKRKKRHHTADGDAILGTPVAEPGVLPAPRLAPEPEPRPEPEPEPEPQPAPEPAPEPGPQQQPDPSPKRRKHHRHHDA